MAAAAGGSAVTFESVAGLQGGWITAEERGIADRLLALGQEHLFADWEAGKDEEKKHAFFAQVKKANDCYEGGLEAYITKARSLLEASARGDNPFAGYVPSVPTGRTLVHGSAEFDALEQEGLSLFKDCAFVLVAGGLGERLGYGGIKVSLPVETSTMTQYLNLYCQEILARQHLSNEMAGTTDRQVPLAIMTSDDTHTRTAELLAANNNFGMAEGQITLIKQEKVPALTDNAARIAGEDGNPYAIQTKPHGHGDVHALLHTSGLAARWAGEGRRYIVFFQDTNSLCFLAAMASLGVSAQEGYAMSSMCVPRKAGEAVGAISRLSHTETGRELTLCVEYNQLGPMMKASGLEGDVNNPETGYSDYPGNVNQLVVDAQNYAAVLERTKGVVPEFVNPKYADESKTKFKKPTRLECMMQEHPRVLAPEDKVGFTTLDAWTYSPVKNSVAEAQAKFAKGDPMRCAAQGEAEFYESRARQMRAMGVKVAETTPFSTHGVEVDLGPRIVLSPFVAASAAQLRSIFPNPEAVEIAANATLVVRAAPGAKLTIESLRLDGALEIELGAGSELTIKGLEVSNEGWEMATLSDEEAAAAPEYLRIRGFQVNKKASQKVEVAAGETKVVE